VEDEQRGRLDELASLVANGDVVVLSGAGISTDSGIPDYRGPTGAKRTAAPMTYQTFTRDAVARRRYWARSHLGWGLIARARPNAGHRAVARLQQLGTLRGVITQNVDGLHTVAGATGVVELHGNLDRVICLDCGRFSSRADLDRRLRAANSDWRAEATAVNPDGDVALPDEQLDGFRSVDCDVCGGMLKPDVVYFGETVPAPRVQHCFDLVDGAGALVVLGSSLSVMSGYRFVLRAAKLGIPVAIVNAGVTRGDARADLRLDLPLGRVLPEVVESVTDLLRDTGRPGPRALPGIPA
jgi:NAD-dependent SIR2 family protein deacetylase